MRLSEINHAEIEDVGGPEDQLGRAGPKQLKLSDISPEHIEIIEPSIDPKTSPVTAATTGIIQGAVPFASALAGAGKAGLDAITGVRGPLAGGSLGDIADDYRSARDTFSSEARGAQEANPKTAFAGSLVGGVANPLFKGANTIPKAMGAGAVQGLGMSDADLTQGKVVPALKDAAMGAGGGALGYGAGKLVGKGIDVAGKAAKKLLTVLGPSGEAIDARLAGKAQDSAKSYPDLAEDLSKSLGSLKNQIIEGGQGARGTLSSQTSLEEGAIPKQFLIKNIDDVLDKMKVDGKIIGSTDSQAANALQNLKGDIDQFDAGISESQVKGIIQALDENINWDDQTAARLNGLLQKVRTGFDTTLKERNPSYKKAMLPVSERAQVMADLKRQFNLKRVPGEGLQPTDTTATKIQTSLRDNKAVTQQNLDKLKEYTGRDYGAEAEDYRLAQQFSKTGANGSRRTVLGGALGSALGSIPGLSSHGVPGVGTAGGAAIGAAAGAVLDRYGGQVAAKLIDSYLKAGNSKIFGKFEPLIRQAESRGPEALAVTGSILSSNPEFRKLMGL